MLAMVTKNKKTVKKTVKKVASKPHKPKAPWFGGGPMESPGPFYAGGQIHWLNKKGKLQHTDEFPAKSQLMTKAEFKRMFA